MHVLTKPKRIIKSTAITGAVAALTLTPAAAFAHGGSRGGDDNGRHNSQRAATAQQSKQDKQKNNDRFSSWWNQNKNRQKLTCSERQDALNKRAEDAKAKYSQRVKGLDIIYGGVQAYVNGGVIVENYDAMNAQVAADQTAATNAVNAIAAPQLNCDDPNTAAAMADDNKTWHDHDNGTNSSINAARDAVNTYRKDLNKLFEAAINS